jgi:hypothetical protein
MRTGEPQSLKEVVSACAVIGSGLHAALLENGGPNRMDKGRSGVNGSNVVAGRLVNSTQEIEI